MSKEAKETLLHPKKALTFINYKKIIQGLSEKLLLLGLEYKTISGKNEPPESFNKFNATTSDVRMILTPQQPANSKKKFIIIDQRQVIDELNQRISLLNEALITLKTNKLSAHDAESHKNSNVLEMPTLQTDKNAIPTDTPLPPDQAPQPINKHAEALASLNHAKIALGEANIFDALKWTDLALKEDPDVFSSINPLDLPETLDFMQIVTKKSANQTLFTFVEACDFNFSQIDSNPTREYFILLEDKSSFLETIQQYQSMINCFDRSNEPLLHVAARFGYYHLMLWLLDNGTPVDLKAQDDRTALLVAAFYGHEPLIKLLIQRGANISHEATNNMTALLLASQSGHFSMVKLFVEKYTDMHLRSLHINMAIVHAAIHEKIPIIEFFLDLGADINFRTPKGVSALGGAANYNSIATVKFLLAHGAKPNNTNLNHQSELSLVMGLNSMEMVKLLVDHGADVNFSGGNGMTPLLRASGNGQVDIVEYLIEKGALVNIQSKNITPLMAACMEGHLNVVTYLVEEAFADVNQLSDFNNQNALMTAAAHNRFEISQYLLDHGSDIDTIKENGWTALTLAADDGYRKLVSLLLSRGANPKNIGNAPLSAEGSKMIEEELEKLSQNIPPTALVDEPIQTAERSGAAEPEEDKDDSNKSPRSNRCSLM